MMTLILAMTFSLIPAAVVYVLLAKSQRRVSRDLEQFMMDEAEVRSARDKELSLLERRIQSLAQQLERLGTDLTHKDEDLARAGESWRRDFETLREEMKLTLEKINQLQQEQKDRSLADAEISAAPLMDSPAVNEVLNLLEEGVSADEIARRQGLQLGEIALIQGLKQFSSKRR